MKKKLILFLVPLVMLSACNTTEQGAFNGASFGAMFGSALGGIIGGPRGHHIGTMVGMIAGGATGAAIGSQQEKRDRPARTQRPERPERPEVSSAPQCPLLLRNFHFIDEDSNQVISRGECCHVVFELVNQSGHTIYDIVPYLSELNGNTHLSISSATLIESLTDGDAIRYTAMIRADNRLKSGTATFRIAVSTDGQEFIPVKDFSIATHK